MRLLVYADPVVALQQRHKKAAGFEGGAVVDCGNWHRPYCLQRVAKLEDFITAKISNDSEAIQVLANACALYRPTQIVFVLPMGFKPEPHYGYAATIVSHLSGQYPDVQHAGIAVTNYGSIAAVNKREHHFMTFAAVVGDRSGRPEHLARMEFEHTYLSWRMSGVLSDLCNCRVGLDPTQFAVLQTAAYDTTERSIFPNLRSQWDFGDAEVFVDNVLGFNDRQHVVNKNEWYRERAREMLAAPKTDTLMTGTLALPLPELTPDWVACRFASKFRSHAHDRMLLLAALQVIEDPYRQTHDMHGVNAQIFQTQGFGEPRLAPVQHVEVNLGYSLSSLLDVGDRELHPIITDMWNRELCYVACEHVKSACHVLRTGPVTMYFPIVKHASYLRMQPYHQSVPTEAAYQSMHFALASEMSAWTPEIVRHGDGPGTLRALGRLLEKRYLTHTGAFHLTEFGAAVYVIAHSIYGKFLSTWGLGTAPIQGEPLDAINAEFVLFRARCDEQLADDEAQGLPKTIVRDKPWSLVVKNSKRGKSCYWKNHTNKRPLGLAFSVVGGAPVPQLTVEPRRNYERQDAAGDTVYNNCKNCGSIVAYRSFSDVEHRSSFTCPNCRTKHDYYITPRLVRS